MKPNKLVAGDKFPINHLLTINDKVIRLRGSSGLLHISLTSRTHCLFCDYTFIRYLKRIPELQRENIESVFISSCKEKSILVDQMEAPWSKSLSIVADPSHKLYLETGVAEKFAWILSLPLLRFSIKRKQNPADFLVDASSGNILAVKYGSSSNDRWSAEDVLNIASMDLNIKGFKEHVAFTEQFQTL